MQKLITLFVILFSFSGAYAQSDGLPRGSYQMPFTRYEADASSLGGGATLLGPTFDQKQITSEASDRVCASLPSQGSSVKWSLSEAGRGLVVRFSIPDGQRGSLALYVDGTFVQDIALDSRQAWQYFSANPGDGTKDPTNTPSPGMTARMRFDEVRVVLPSSVAAGTEVRLQKTSSDNIDYVVDFIEMEPVPAPIAQPANSLSVTDFGADPNDENDDLQAFNDCLNAAKSQGQDIYIPAGRFLLGEQGGKWVFFQVNGVTVQGAGIWHTELYFSNPGPNSGGIESTGSDLHFKDFYMNTVNDNRTAGYKGFTGGYGTNSSIERVWVEHFEVGVWIANWSGTEITDGMLVTGSRFRNNYADGLNFSKGTSNSICEQSHFRNNGDDAMATWSSFDSTIPCTNNEFRFCTAENTWRAAGIGFFGGGGHSGHHLIIKDNVEAGIRVNSDFPGPAFSKDLWMEFYECTVIGSGTNANLWFNRYGAIDIFTRLYDLQNLRFRNVDVLDSQKDAVMIYTVNPAYPITNLEMINVTIDGAGQDGNVNNYTEGTYDDYAGHGVLVLPDVTGDMTTQNLVIRDAPTAAILNESEGTFIINNTGGSADVTGVSISPTDEVSLAQGGTAPLTANVQPANATNQQVTWTSSDPAVATVDATGLVTAVASGEAVITVETEDGGFTATQTVTVTSAPTDNSAPVAGAGTDQVLAVGTTSARLSGTGSDADDDPLTYTWSQVSGPTATLSDASEATAAVSGLANGARYVFRLTVSDGTLSGSDNVQITVQDNNGPTIATSYRIKNRWQNTYLYDAGDRVKYEATASGSSYEWVLEDIGSGQLEIRNVGTGDYMHIENQTGYVQATARTPGWYSSRWVSEDAGDGHVRLRNAWQGNQYVHVENLSGDAQHGTIYPVWASAQWVLEPVGASATARSASVTTVYPNPVVSGYLDVVVKNAGASAQPLRLYTLTGELVAETIARPTRTRLDIPEVPTGVYVLKVGSGASQEVQKIVVRR